MVSTKNGDAVLVTDLEGDKQRHSLHGIVPTVNIITHEEVVCVGGLPSNAEQLHQIVELSMNVSAHGDGALYRLHVLFLDENLTSLCSKFRERGVERSVGDWSYI